MKHYSHLNTALQIIDAYKGAEPFSLFIKKKLSAQKKYGSRDRRSIASLCYDYFRLGHAAGSMSAEERMLAGVFVCENSSSEFLQNLRPDWNAAIGYSLTEKAALIEKGFSSANIFPWKEQLSREMDHELFCLSFLQQPSLFIRIRPGHAPALQQKIKDAGLEFKMPFEDAIALPNATKTADLFTPDKEAVIQDLSSQKTGVLMKLCTFSNRPEVWDCCAASGGKSILLYDMLKGGLHLRVSDNRPSILNNLKNRFSVAGIRKYDSAVLDLSKENTSQLPKKNYDLILCDAPCTGSGTWARTPEQLCFFSEEKINAYADLQKKIVSNVIPSLKKDGWFLYITCSVFKKENEDTVDFIKEKFHLELARMELLKGYESQADTMFAALFKKTV